MESIHSAKVTVSDITITDLRPVIDDPSLAALLPKRLFPMRLEAQIANVSNAVSNALRRTLSCEMPVIALAAKIENIKTNDPFIIHEMIAKRLRMIPIDQKTPLDATFEIDFVNNSPILVDVKSGEIKMVSKGVATALPFNSTFTLFTLEPGKFIKISNITIDQEFGYKDGYGMHVMACNAVSIAVDQQPINSYDPAAGGIPSRMSNPRVWKLGFNTNGTLPPAEMVAAACDNIIMRLHAAQNLMYSIKNNGDEYILTISGESDTIGNLFMRTVNDLFPDIRAATYSSASVGRSMTLRIRCDEDINIVLGAAIKYLINVFGDIKRAFE